MENKEMLKKETLDKLSELTAGTEIRFKMVNDFFLMYIENDTNHTFNFFGHLDVNGKPYITGGMDEDYFINRNITHPDDDFKKLLKFCNVIIAALSDNDFRNKLSQIMNDYYMSGGKMIIGKDYIKK